MQMSAGAARASELASERAKCCSVRAPARVEMERAFRALFCPLRPGDRVGG